MRLIDADKISFYYGGLVYIEPHDGMKIAEYFADQIKAMPTIDAVEVVRCKDCKNCAIESNHLFCKIFMLYTNSDDFCSSGEQVRNAT